MKIFTKLQVILEVEERSLFCNKIIKSKHIYLWGESICLTKFSFRQNPTSFEGLFFFHELIWYAYSVFKCPFWENLASQMSHVNGFFPSWTDLMCLNQTFFFRIATFEWLFPFMNWFNVLFHTRAVASPSFQQII